MFGSYNWHDHVISVAFLHGKYSSSQVYYVLFPISSITPTSSPRRSAPRWQSGKQSQSWVPNSSRLIWLQSWIHQSFNPGVFVNCLIHWRRIMAENLGWNTKLSTCLGHCFKNFHFLLPHSDLLINAHVSRIEINLSLMKGWDCKLFVQGGRAVQLRGHLPQRPRGRPHHAAGHPHLLHQVHHVPALREVRTK